jgi:hypothetical protein
VEGQKGVFKDKVWTPNGGGDGVPDLENKDGDGTANRFAGFMDEGQEELIVPGKNGVEGQHQEGTQATQQGEAQAETQAYT